MTKDKKLCVFNKIATESDRARQQNRLRLKKDLVKTKILPNLTTDENKKINNGGLPVKVIDEKTGKDYETSLKTWNKGNCYVINGAELSKFIEENNFKVNDMMEISVQRVFLPEEGGPSAS